MPYVKLTVEFGGGFLFQITDCQGKITIRAILFNIFQQHVTTRFNEILIILINLMKYCIWNIRNEAKHESKTVTTLGIKAFLLEPSLFV